MVEELRRAWWVLSGETRGGYWMRERWVRIKGGSVRRGAQKGRNRTTEGHAEHVTGWVRVKHSPGVLKPTRMAPPSLTL